MRVPYNEKTAFIYETYVKIASEIAGRQKEKEDGRTEAREKSKSA